MEQYLIDTNVISDYLSESFSVKSMALMDGIIDEIPNISIITQIELECCNVSDSITKKVKDFIGDSQVLNINTDVIAQCVKLRKEKKIKTPDAIIAATALAYGFTLITNNVKDFININDLKILNPHNL